jgi:hypothetical protein
MPMPIRLLVLFVVIVLFGVLSTVAILEVGYIGLIEPHLKSWGASQILVDLVIMGLLACIWMVTDARERGLNPWPYVVLTLVGGSFGPLVYLVARELNSSARRTSRLEPSRGRAT